ncbi:MAG: ATP-dependent DNA helicase [Leptothrix sp. (in: b-proteobacteria)]
MASTKPPSPCVVAVRTLCEFTAKAGDLDLRFTPAPTALEGIEGHALVVGRRGAGYVAELSLAGVYTDATGRALGVRGRADGWDASAGRLEEIKTHRGSLDRQPTNHRALHWAQAEVYGHLLCAQDGRSEVELALVYFDVARQTETVLTRRCSAAELAAWFDARCAAYLAWAELEQAHRAARDAALAALAFPHTEFRLGQRALAEAVYRTAASGRCLMAQAPTGIGKTLGTLFPLLKALPPKTTPPATAATGIDRIFFLTAKTSGRALALDALATLGGSGAEPLRTLELVARDKACEHPDLACHGGSCPLARGFYDRLADARRAALALPMWHKDAVRALAAQHAVCPYYLTQELARWADVVVGDYNHYFDSTALLHGLTQALGWRVALLVDEAHNLVERARSMYSAGFDADRLQRLRRLPQPAELKTALDRVMKRWKAVLKTAFPTAAAADPAARQTATPTAAQTTAQTTDYQLLDAVPAPLLEALQQASTAILNHLAEHPNDTDAALLDFAFEALQLTRLAEVSGAHTLVDLTRREAGAGGMGAGFGAVRQKDLDRVRLSLRNVVPAPHLAPRIAAAHTLTLFSATLAPQAFHADLLGLPTDTAWIDVAAPFAAEQLQVHVARDISTRWQHRGASRARIAERIARQFEQAPGNYLAFFSSFDYLEQVADAVAAAHPALPLWRQQRGMREAEQAAFLARFRAGGQGIGFAVLGGAFAEGIDLPGERLIGAFIATLGLPQVNAVNEQMRARIDRIESLAGHGHDYTYLVPGLQKVVQAAGRVIRTPQDRGVIHLLDDRYARREVRALLPRWWGEPAG